MQHLLYLIFRENLFKGVNDVKNTSNYSDLATYGLTKIGRKFIHEYSGIEFIYVQGGVF